MKTETLVYFEFQRKEKSIKMKDTCKVYRTLYGYKNSSCYGRYRTQVKGMLDRIDGTRVAKSLFIVPNEYAKEVISFLEDNAASVKSWQIIPVPEE